MKRAAALVLAAAAAAAATLPCGCVGSGIGGEELDQPPIAILYWDRKAARERSEAMTGLRGPNRLGVARVGDVGRLLGATTQAAEDLDRRFPGHLCLVDPATATVTRVEAAPAGALPLAWSADHRRLLLAARRGSAGLQLYEYDVEEGDLRRMTTGPLPHGRGSYADAGRLVVLAQLAGDRYRVELTRTPSQPSRVLFEGPFVDSVRWSPRGDMLALAVIAPDRAARRGEATRMLFTLSPDAPPQTWPPGEGSMLRPLGRGRDPVFSADGEWIVYSARVGDGWRLRRVRTTGGGRLAVGRGSRDELEPGLSPDGRLVAYVSEENGLHRLFVRRVDGSGDRLLVTDGVVARPTW